MNRVLHALTHVLGAAAFLSPFLTGAVERSGESSSHAADAPFLFSLLSVLVLGLAVSEVRAGRMSTKEIALLGVLCGVNAALRLPGSLGGASLMFLLPILAAAALGARFGFMLGALSMAVSAILTGGIGPWLPFQMWALGWVASGGALARLVPARCVRARVGILVCYGWAAGLLYGAIVNLWFWPFIGGPSEISWQPGASGGDSALRYWRFYVLTSLAWDAGRALANALLIAAFGAPLLRTLDRFARRLHPAWVPGTGLGRSSQRATSPEVVLPEGDLATAPPSRSSIGL